MATDDRRRIALEAIAYGEDSSNGDRLRALELLERLGDATAKGPNFYAELEEIPDEELWAHLRNYFIPVNEEEAREQAVRGRPVSVGHEPMSEAGVVVDAAAVDELQHELALTQSALEQERQRVAEAARGKAALEERAVAAEQERSRQASQHQQQLADTRQQLEALRDLPHQLA